jgi:hypothetical protein
VQHLRAVNEATVQVYLRGQQLYTSASDTALDAAAKAVRAAESAAASANALQPRNSPTQRGSYLMQLSDSQAQAAPTAPGGDRVKKVPHAAASAASSSTTAPQRRGAKKNQRSVRVISLLLCAVLLFAWSVHRWPSIGGSSLVLSLHLLGSSVRCFVSTFLFGSSHLLLLLPALSDALLSFSPKARSLNAQLMKTRLSLFRTLLDSSLCLLITLLIVERKPPAPYFW